jgi:hypothetical protein
MSREVWSDIAFTPYGGYVGIPNADPSRWRWGAFEWGTLPPTETQGVGSMYISPNTATGDKMLTFKSSRVVPTGPQNSPQTVSTKFWRRIS